MSGNEDTFLFYDADGVQRLNGQVVRFWLKSITRANLEKYYGTHESRIVEQVSRKIAAGYTPKFFNLDAIRVQYRDPTTRQYVIVEASRYEAIANEIDVPMRARIYFELDCRERKTRLLEMTTFGSKGEVARRSLAHREGEFIAPDSNGDWQAQLICGAR